MSLFQEGQIIRVTGDSFEADPHHLEIGTEYVINKIQEPTPFEEFPQMIQLLFALSGKEEYDLPARINVHFFNEETGEDDFANIVFEDAEVVGEEDTSTDFWDAEVGEVMGATVRLLEDDMAEGFFKGDTFELFELDGQAVFADNDGDPRPIAIYEHEIV